MTEQQAIHRYVFEFGELTAGVTSISCLRAAVRDARQLTGRKLDTGAPRTRLKRGKAVWPGTPTYLVLLDQVGQVLAPKRRKPTTEPFMDALADFAPALTNRDRHMLYALRCAFAHEIALANEGRGRHALDRRHLFELHEARDRRLALYPACRWNGLYGNRANRKTGTTKVNLTEVGTVVEDVVAKIEAAASAGQLRLVRGVTPAMVASRWGFQVYDAPFS